MDSPSLTVHQVLGVLKRVSTQLSAFPPSTASIPEWIKNKYLGEESGGSFLFMALGMTSRTVMPIFCFCWWTVARLGKQNNPLPAPPTSAYQVWFFFYVGRLQLAVSVWQDQSLLEPRLLGVCIKVFPRPGQFDVHRAKIEEERETLLWELWKQYFCWFYIAIILNWKVHISLPPCLCFPLKELKVAKPKAVRCKNLWLFESAPLSGPCFCACKTPAWLTQVNLELGVFSEWFGQSLWFFFIPTYLFPHWRDSIL